MTFTEYVRLEDQITGYLEERKILDATIERLRLKQRAAASKFPPTFYVTVENRLVYRSDGGRDVRVVTPGVE